MNKYDAMIFQGNNTWPRNNSTRIILFADLRDSTEILLNFEKRMYKKTDGKIVSDFDYGEFILDVHETSYRELYLGHSNTYSEIYGDGVMGVFPGDNTKFILENIYRLSKRMRLYNDSLSTNPFLTLYEILVDNDPRFEAKQKSIAVYAEAYSKYCQQKWEKAKELFSAIYKEYGLGVGHVMAKRCDVLSASPPNYNWEGVWNLKQK